MNYQNNSNLSKVDRWFQRAFAAHQTGQIVEAKNLYEQVLQKTPNDMEVLYLLGTACSQLGKFEEALAYLQKATAIAPEHPEALNNMGLTLKALGKEPEAIACYSKALSLRPDYADAHNNLGNVLELLREYDDAEAHLRKAIHLNPNLADAYYNLGLVLKAKDKFEEAVKCFLRGISLKPNFDVAYNDLGQIYKIWGRFESALACFDHALTLAPLAYSLHNNRGATLEELGRMEEALEEYQLASDLFPDLVTPRWNLAFLFLRQGRLDRGWEYHELRLKTGQVENRFPFPEWDGSPLKDKVILIYAEQGLGDEILFASCFGEIIAQSKHCIIECEPRLAPLFARSFPDATVVGAPRDDKSWLATVPNIDLQVAAGSLPRFLRKTLESFPDAPGYLIPDSRKTAYWRSRMAELGLGLKVGICWRSGLVKGERHRSYSQLTQWGEIFSIPGVHFINLQYDECTDELQEAEDLFKVTISNFPEVNLKQQIDESAALISSLDLVISAATAVSEIAGSIGIEVYRPDEQGVGWTSLGTDRMPWHPKMHLFRQVNQGDWETPLALIADALRSRVHRSGGDEVIDTIKFVPLTDNTQIAVNGSLDDMYTYVLKEQKAWFDPEYQFVVSMIKPDMRVVDLGAGVGVYSVAIANRTDVGQVWAMTGTPSETNLLMRSKVKNAFEKRLNIGIVKKAPSLDAEMDRHGLDNISFLRIGPGMFSMDLLLKSERFFQVNSPLVMIGLSGRDSLEISAAEWFIAHGYSLYRFAPGLGALIPLTSTGELDIYTLNVFACKGDRAATLEAEEMVIRHDVTLSTLPGADAPYWYEYLETQPHAADLLTSWKSSGKTFPEWEIYWMALNIFALSKNTAKSGAERYAYLQTSVNVLTALVKERATLPRLLSLTRLLSDLGKREAAIGLLNQICGLLTQGLAPHLEEPCIALNDAYANIRPGECVKEWTIAMILAQRETLRAFSTFFTGKESLTVLEEVVATGFYSDDVKRRIGLIGKRFNNGFVHPEKSEIV